MRLPGDILLLKRRAMYVGILLVFSVVLAACFPLPTIQTPTPMPTVGPDTGDIVVNVYDENDQLLSDGVLMRVAGSLSSDGNDNNKFLVGPCNQGQYIAVWAPGHETTYQLCDGVTKLYSVKLFPLNGNDNINYSWRAANVECVGCHANETNQWAKSSHAQALTNRFFETMYKGTSVSDPVAQPTGLQVFNTDLVRVPDVNNPNYHGPGFQLDFPQQAGNCSYCHAPAAVSSSNQSVDLNPFFSNYTGASGEGITCDVCHKVFNVVLDKDGFPFLDRPGRLSFTFLRSDNINFHFGPFVNIANGNPFDNSRKSICSPVFNRSDFCAACHYAKFGEIMIYDSFGEWRASKYGVDPASQDYKTCQDCHMSHVDSAAKLEAPFSNRDGCTEDGTTNQNFSHDLMDVKTTLNKDTNVSEEVSALIRGAAEVDYPGFLYQPSKKNSLGVVITVTNKKAGHKFPTDSPLRHLILVVEAEDRQGTPLIQTDGEVIPPWGGVGININGMGNYGGKAGKIYANLLKEMDTNISPTAAYWNPTELAWVDLENKTDSDTRLVPDAPDKSEYFFTTPSSGDVTVIVKLIYRYAFIELAARKGWTRPDIIVATWVCKGPPKETAKITCQKKETYSP